MAISFIKPRIATANTDIAKPPPKQADPFYLSSEWRALLAQIIAQRGRRCEDPACERPSGPWSRIYGDHVVELKDGGAPLDPGNVLLRCAPCHARKTIATRAARMARSTAPRGV